LQTCRAGGAHASLASGNHKITAAEYYSEYHGHKTEHLAHVHANLKQQGCENFVFLAGDSSLDNKHWFFDPHKTKRQQLTRISKHNSEFADLAVNGYEDVLKPPMMVKDVSYWLNKQAEQLYGSKQMATIMTSVEESTVQDRIDGLLAQDVFIRDHITENDNLVISIGGNDVALRPSIQTMLSMKLLTSSPDFMIKSGWAPGFGHFMHLFKTEIQNYVRELCAKCKPKKVLVCMIYYLDEQAGGSWADRVLSALGYDADPSKLQLIIRTLFEKIEEQGFDVPGVDVEPFPLFQILDGKDTTDYVQRVEPSVTGGRKMAAALLGALPPPS